MNNYTYYNIQNIIFNIQGSFKGGKDMSMNEREMESILIQSASLSQVLNSNDHVFNQFNRFKISEGLEYSASPVAYVFFTKPDLNFSNENLAGNNFLRNLSRTTYGLEIMRNLTCTPFHGIGNVGQGFMKILTNMAENFDNMDNSLRTDTFVETFRGYKMQLPVDDIDSTTAGNFSISFTEIMGIPLTLLHKAWIDYIIGLRVGRLEPDDIYKKNRIIDYMCSVFYIELAPDGRTIEYFSKYTGVFPTNIPYSSFSWNIGEGKTKKLSIQYAYTYKEDLDPEILKDFEEVTRSEGRGNSDAPYRLKYNWASGVGIDINRSILYFG